MATSNLFQAVAQEPSLATIRALVRAYQAFARYSETFVRQYDLTPAQFDVIATLGNTQGLTMGCPMAAIAEICAGLRPVSQGRTMKGLSMGDTRFCSTSAWYTAAQTSARLATRLGLSIAISGTLTTKPNWVALAVASTA